MGQLQAGPPLLEIPCKHFPMPDRVRHTEFISSSFLSLIFVRSTGCQKIALFTLLLFTVTAFPRCMTHKHAMLRASRNLNWNIWK